MKITAINSIKYTNQYGIKNNSRPNTQTTQNGVYNPVYYSDYNVNINFGKRSPEDFYAQDFNKNNMPETMEKYLYAKFAERSKIAPVQIMSEAYDGLRTAFTTDDIKARFPDEQFQKLRPANYSAATTGVLKKIKDIKAMQDTPEPLFKDGCDDLTTYIVKKIYLEGKTVKEIDKDFAQDINEIYELAARVPSEAKKTAGKNESVYFSHSTLYNLGIRFPKVPFWNSFIATRDDYERTNRVRTITGEFVNADSNEGKAEIARRKLQHAEEPPKPRRYTFKRHNVKQISDNIVNSKGETSKALKKSNKNAEELTFLQKYWSQIMSVATEKVHLSDELIDFNNSRKSEQTKVEASVMDKLISGTDLTSSETTPFKIFWNERTDLKNHFSNAITDTVMLFTEEFGADGNNPRFQALLAYADGIKPEREARKLEHARIQAEYDKLALTPETEVTSAKTQVEELKSTLQDLKEPEFLYTVNGQEIRTNVDIERQAARNLTTDFTLIPKYMANIYKQHLEEITRPDRTRFLLTASFINDANAPAEIKALLHSEDEIKKINSELIEILETKYNPQLEATRFSLLEYAGQRGLLTPNFIQKHARSDILTLRDDILTTMDESENISRAEIDINNIFKRVCTPLTNKEKNAVRQDLFEYLKDYQMNNALWPETFIPRLLKLISDQMYKDKGYVKDVKTMLQSDTIFEFEGPVLRQATRPSTPTAIKTMIRERGVQHILSDFPQLVALITTADETEFRRMMVPFPVEMQNLLDIAKKTKMKYVKII